MKHRKLFWVQYRTPEDANTLGPFSNVLEAQAIADNARRQAEAMFGNWERQGIDAQVVETRV